MGIHFLALDVMTITFVALIAIQIAFITIEVIDDTQEESNDEF